MTRFRIYESESSLTIRVVALSSDSSNYKRTGMKHITSTMKSQNLLILDLESCQLFVFQSISNRISTCIDITVFSYLPD